ncbi:MAG: hypothetical protein OIF48_14275 [Silicimonas sp.]|nr:hypothetical protein [Silicimonas sp.]
MRAPLALCLTLSALPGHAQDQVLSLEAFERLVTGQTFYFQSEGRDYGAEDYRDGRRVRWSFLDGECLEGEYYAEGPLICFSYEEFPGPQCWEFRLRGGRLVGLFEGDPGNTVLIESGRRDEPLYCLGPEVGV